MGTKRYSCVRCSTGADLGSGILTGFFGYGPGNSDSSDDYIYSIGFLFLKTIVNVETSTDDIDTTEQAAPDWTYVNSIVQDNQQYAQYTAFSFSYEKVEGYTASYSEESTKSEYFGIAVGLEYSYTATAVASETSAQVNSLWFIAPYVTFCLAESGRGR